MKKDKTKASTKHTLEQTLENSSPRLAQPTGAFLLG